MWFASSMRYLPFWICLSCGTVHPSGRQYGQRQNGRWPTDALRQAIENTGMDYVINEGDGAFYGPKLDFHLQDSLGRTWQCGTMQLDFQLPQRFEAEYIDADGQKCRPIMIHRVVFGSIERFIGILIEHYAGKFPFWFSPVPVKILPVSDKFRAYGRKVEEKLKRMGVRVNVDERNEKLGYKSGRLAWKRYRICSLLAPEEGKDTSYSEKPGRSGR